ncbi:hypothetical protein Dsin_023444 [Dipteronia sinensis]|uniref:Uncharacterized protein n=1 Tax=Dipteronia sinensis TaxID=43782 RepID=A0AAE0A3K7_9ROSI|nr:hypothetical protein Dsin_023444 [Dipteronia sinensis]
MARGILFYYGEDLRNFAWKNHRAGTPLRVIDPILRGGFHSGNDAMHCHWIIMCARSCAKSVDLMLNSCFRDLPRPGKPARSWRDTSELDNPESTLLDTRSVECSMNEISISD